MAKTLQTDPNVQDLGIEGEEAKVIILTREQIRAAMFADANAKPKVIEYEFLGQKLEWRCPSIQEMQDIRDQEGRNLMVSLIIGYSFIPGTDDHVFSDDDYNTIMQMPISGSFNAAVGKIGEAINLKVEDKVKN